MKKNGVHSTFQHIQLVLANYFKQFEHEYTLSSQERQCYLNQGFVKTGDKLICDLVLVKENNIPWMNWKKGMIVKVIRGRGNMVRGVELCIFQPKLNRTMTINRPLQLIVPFEINKPEDDITHSRRNTAVNAEVIIKLLVNDKQQ